MTSASGGPAGAGPAPRPPDGRERPAALHPEAPAAASQLTEDTAPTAWPITKSITGVAASTAKRTGRAWVACCATCSDLLAIPMSAGPIPNPARVPGPWIHDRTGNAACAPERLRRHPVACPHCHQIGDYGAPCPQNCSPDPLH